MLSTAGRRVVRAVRLVVRRPLLTFGAGINSWQASLTRAINEVLGEGRALKGKGEGISCAMRPHQQRSICSVIVAQLRLCCRGFVERVDPPWTAVFVAHTHAHVRGVSHTCRSACDEARQHRTLACVRGVAYIDRLATRRAGRIVGDPRVFPL